LCLENEKFFRKIWNFSVRIENFLDRIDDPPISKYGLTPLNQTSGVSSIIECTHWRYRFNCKLCYNSNWVRILMITCYDSNKWFWFTALKNKMNFYIHPPNPIMHFPLPISDFPLFQIFLYLSTKISNLFVSHWLKFFNFPLFPQNLYISSLFPEKLNFSPISYISPNFRKKFYYLFTFFASPYFDHDAFMHHTIHALNAIRY